MIRPDSTFQGLNITFNTTEDCNLACKYCYEVNKKPKTLSLDYAKKFIDLLLDEEDVLGVKNTNMEWIANSGIILDFIGGDALMNIDLVRKICEYWQKEVWKKKINWATRWRISISTNGTLFDNIGVKEFLEEYKRNIHLGISIDGCPEIHDLNRTYVDGSGSMKDILKNWDYYLNWCDRAGIRPATKATLNKESIPFISESIRFLHEDLKLNIINMNFVMEDLQIDQKDIEILDMELKKSTEYILEHRHDLYVSLLDRAMGIGTPMNQDGRDKGRCGSGSMPALGINGKIYPCFRYLPHTAMDYRDDFHVGDVENGFYRKDRFEMVRCQTREKISDSECLNCPIESMCAYCIGGCYAEYGEFKRTKHICELAKKQDKYTKLYWREHDKLEGTNTIEAYLPTYEEYIRSKENE